MQGIGKQRQGKPDLIRERDKKHARDKKGKKKRKKAGTPQIAKKKKKKKSHGTGKQQEREDIKTRATARERTSQAMRAAASGWAEWFLRREENLLAMFEMLTVQ